MNKVFTGKVVSTKMEKTVVVDVERRFRHPLYRKVIVKHKRYKVHNEDKEVKDGDMVAIKETRPISKDKHFILIGKVTKKT